MASTEFAKVEIITGDLAVPRVGRADIRRLLKNLLPPFLLPLLRKMDCGNVRYAGDYASWDEARRHSTGYEDAAVLERAIAATKRVLAGEAAFERDTVCFAKPEYRWPLTATLLWVAAQNRGRLDVIDFGGALGSTYLQNREFLDGLERVRWRILEQPAFVAQGKNLFLDSPLEFLNSIDECPNEEPGQLLLLSSVLQYIPDPYPLLSSVLARKFSYVIVDRTPFIVVGQLDRLMVQIVPPHIYPASYPCRALSLEHFMNHFHPSYDMVAELECEESSPVDGCEYKGFVFRRNGMG